jgi:hypothetical protein
MQNENDQFMRHAVQPRLVLVTEALRALRPLTTTNTGVGPIEAAVQRLVDRSAAVVIALNHHPDRITRIGAWEDIVHARGLQTTEPLGEASAPPIFRLPLALLQKIGESLKKLQLLDGTAGEVLGAFKKIETLTARLLSEVNEDNFGLKPADTVSHLSRTKWCKYLPQQSEHTGGEMAAAREVLDEIEGIVDYATSLMSWPLGFTTMDLRLLSATDPQYKCVSEPRSNLLFTGRSQIGKSYLLNHLSLSSFSSLLVDEVQDLSHLLLNEVKDLEIHKAA